RFTDVLPAALHGQANGRLRLQGTTDELDVDGWAAFRERGGATSRVAADGRLRNLDGTVQARAVTLHFDPLQLSLARRFAPDLAMAGRITGRATLTGSTRSGFDLNADLSHVGAPAGRSRVLADGRLLLDEGPVARDLRLRFDPLQVALARTLVASLPLDGTLTGRATLNGRLAERVRADLDVRHHAATGPSHLVGRADVTFGTPTRFDVAVRAPELSLATLGRFAPAAQLRGSASGRIALQGTSARFAVDTRLAVARGGLVDLRGTFAPQRGVPRYDFSTRFANFDAAAVSGRAPPTVLEGVVVATGQGFDPATMNATVRADLVDVQLGDGSVAADSTRLLVRLEDGLATAERAHIRLASVRADLEGSFGLVAGRTGELRFDVHIDSAGQFRGYLPGADTGLVPPRPRLQQRAIATARQDSLRIARATEVERAATGQPPLPPLRYDTIPPVPRDSLAGSLRATGVLVGNIEAFDARGEAMAERLVFGGNSLARGRADFVLTGASTPNPRLELNAAADSLRAGGFAFDSARIRADYAGTPGRGQGSAEIDIHQEPDHDYSLASRFRLSTERSELILERLAVNLDTVRWNATRPGVISWGGSGIELGHIELASTGGGRIFAEGRLPSEGEADVRLEVAQLQLGSLAPLLQDTMLLTGLLSLDARLRGTRAAPRIEGTTSLDSAHYAGTWLPDLRARFTYAGAELEARAEALRGARLLATAEGRLPIDLALQEVAGGRLLDGPLRAEIRADSLPLDALPSFTDQVTEIRGRVRGQASVAGTVRDPAVEGVAELDLGSLRLAATGVRMTEVNGVVRFDGETATLDSLVAQARGGSVRVSGTLGLAQLTRPSFDLAMTSDGAQLLNNEHGDIRADANLTLAGAFDAPRVEGTVRVTEGVVYVPDIGHRRATELDLPELAQVVDTAAISPALIPRASPFLENLSLDVGVRVARNTWARNTRANVEIYTTAEDPLHIRMERGTNSLRVTGSIAAERGEYTYSGRTFGLNSGTATFLGTGEINPLLQLNGQYAVQRPGREALVIQITVSGVLRQPTVTLSSNAQPPLSQSELLAYFAFGGSSSSLLDLNSSSVAGGGGLSGLSTLAQQQLAGVAVGAVMEDVVADLQQEGTRAGLDVFRIRPAAVPEEIGFESYFQNILRGTEVEAGKYLSSRVFVGVQGRTSQALPGVRAEYRTPSGFSL
ncbi:MAG TPA: translocation/assembly module TamB domain-containing protein, partial [Longimicrobiales bacterium]|nr:translocation/assembly module TamB domain-containing protein [Longimicrobiales bacterium]